MEVCQSVKSPSVREQRQGQVLGGLALTRGYDGIVEQCPEARQASSPKSSPKEPQAVGSELGLLVRPLEEPLGELLGDPLKPRGR